MEATHTKTHWPSNWVFILAAIGSAAGLDPKNDIENVYADDGVRAWCTIKNTNEALEQKGVSPGETLLVLQSLRYTKDTFENALKETGHNYTLLDVNNPFVGALIKT